MSLTIGSALEHGWLYDYQTLVAGILAIVAAIGTAWAVLRAAQMPLEHQIKEQAQRLDRQKIYAIRRLHIYAVFLKARTEQCSEMLLKVKSTTPKFLSLLALPTTPLIEEWTFIDILPIEAAYILYKLDVTVSAFNELGRASIFDNLPITTSTEAPANLLSMASKAAQELKTELETYDIGLFGGLPN